MEPINLVKIAQAFVILGLFVLIVVLMNEIKQLRHRIKALEGKFEKPWCFNYSIDLLTGIRKIMERAGLAVVYESASTRIEKTQATS